MKKCYCKLVECTGVDHFVNKMYSNYIVIFGADWHLIIWGENLKRNAHSKLYKNLKTKGF